MGGSGEVSGCSDPIGPEIHDRPGACDLDDAAFGLSARLGTKAARALRDHLRNRDPPGMLPAAGRGAQQWNNNEQQAYPASR